MTSSFTSLADRDAVEAVAVLVLAVARHVLGVGVDVGVEIVAVRSAHPAGVAVAVHVVEVGSVAVLVDAVAAVVPAVPDAAVAPRAEGIPY